MGYKGYTSPIYTYKTSLRATLNQQVLGLPVFLLNVEGFNPRKLRLLLMVSNCYPDCKIVVNIGCMGINLDL